VYDKATVSAAALQKEANSQKKDTAALKSQTQHQEREHY